MKLQLIIPILLAFCATFPLEIKCQDKLEIQNLNETLIANAIEFITPFKQEIRDWFWKISGIRNPKELHKPQPRADFITCELCTPALPALKALLELNISEETFIAIATFVCVSLDLAPKPEICQPTIKSYATSVLYMLSNRPDLLVTDICGIMNPGCGEVTPRLTDWVIKISDKPHVETRPAVPGNIETIKILQFTDIHLDLDYNVGSNADCGLPICCRDGVPDNEKNTAGKYGHFGCALPETALDAMYQHANQTHGDAEFVFLTGDYVHSGVWLYSPEENGRHIEATTSKLREAFPNTVIYPLTGNHEPEPVNMYAPPSTWHRFDMSWMYGNVSKHFEKHIPSPELRNFKEYGYYTVTPPGHPNLRIIALNTNLCYIDNFWLAYDPIDTGGQLQWLANTLAYAEQLGQHVIIIGHILPGSGSCWPPWSNQFNRIIQRYEHLIRGQFYGHSHEQYYTLALEDTTHRPISVSFVGGSGLTDGMNSAYNVYHVDGKRGMDSTWEIMNQETYILNLTDSNSAGEPKFQKLVDAKADYKLKNMRADGLLEFANRMICDDELFLKYITTSAKGSDSPRLQLCTDMNCKVGPIGEIVSFNSADRSAFEEMQNKILNRDCNAVTDQTGEEISQSPRIIYASSVLTAFLYLILTYIC